MEKCRGGHKEVNDEGVKNGRDRRGEDLGAYDVYDNTYLPT